MTDLCMKSLVHFLCPASPLTGSSRLVLWSGTTKMFGPASSASAVPRSCDRSSRGWAENTVALRMTLKVSSPIFIISMPLRGFSAQKLNVRICSNWFLKGFRGFPTLCFSDFNTCVMLCDVLILDPLVKVSMWYVVTSLYLNTVTVAFQQRH